MVGDGQLDRGDTHQLEGISTILQMSYFFGPLHGAGAIFLPDGVLSSG